MTILLYLIAVIGISTIRFSKLLQWLFIQYKHIDTKLEKPIIHTRLAKTFWLNIIGYSLEFTKGLLLLWITETYFFYNDLLMPFCIIIVITLYIWNPFEKFKPNNHDWIAPFSGILYFLSPYAPLYFIGSILVLLLLSNSIAWSYTVAIIISGIIINNTSTVSIYLLYFFISLIPLSIILSTQLYEFHTLKRGTLTDLIKKRS